MTVYYYHQTDRWYQNVEIAKNCQKLVSLLAKREKKVFKNKKGHEFYKYQFFYNC